MYTRAQAIQATEDIHILFRVTGYLTKAKHSSTRRAGSSEKGVDGSGRKIA